MSTRSITNFVFVSWCVFLLAIASGCSKKVDENSTIDILTRGNLYRSKVSFRIENGKIIEPPKDASVVLVVRDFVDADKDMLEKAKSQGLKEGKAYLRVGAEPYTYKFLADVDLSLSDEEICKRLRGETK
jgi:hypothetical protein